MSPRRRGLVGIALWGALLAGPVMAPAWAEEAASRTVLRVCQDPNNLPFSNTAGQGYENKIADLIGAELKRPVEYFNLPNRLAFVRNTLRYRLPNEAEYRCDLMVGAPAGFDQVSTTRPYYRSTYALVFARGRGLDGVTTGADFLKLPPGELRKLKIGVFDLSPASQWLARHGLVDQGVPYQQMNPNPDQAPGDVVQADLSSGKIDVAILWGPLAGHMARSIKGRQMVVAPLASEPGVQLDYEMAMGVRYGEPEWKAAIQSAIDKRRPEIEAILKDYRVPLLPPKPAG